MNRTIQASWDHIRSRLFQARNDADISLERLSRRCGCAKGTLRQLETGNAYSRSDTLIAYAQALGLDLTVVNRHTARLTALGRDDVVAILRAAQAAADGHRLTPMQARRVTEALAQLHPQEEPP